MPKNNKTGIVGREKEAFIFRRKAASASGENSVHLHRNTHIFNMSETGSGVIKPIQPLEFFKTQKLATAIYRCELADRIQRLGYEIEIDQRTGAPEIKGFSAEYVKVNSLRSAELQRETESIKIRFELEGVTIKNDAGIRQIAAWQGRETKGFNSEEMKTRALEIDVRHDFQAQRIVGMALQNNGYEYNAEVSQQKAKEAIDYAKEVASIRTGVGQDLSSTSLSESRPHALNKLNERQFLTEALNKGLGNTHFAAVQQEYSARSAAGEFSDLIKNGYESLVSKELSQILVNETVYEFSNTTLGDKESAGIQQTVDILSEELNPIKELDKFSMNDLEKIVREKISIENEIARSTEFGLEI